jgi:NAD(P)H-dependent FMN reductase
MLLRAVARIAPADLKVELYRDLGRIPPFNPDLDEQGQPVVMALRRALVAADAVLIASPEYAHGVSGVLKNALDWLVGSTQGEIVDKPVALINASPRSTHAQASLVETLRTMSARVVADVRLGVSLKAQAFDEASLRDEPDVVRVVSSALAALEAAVRVGPAPEPV